MENIPNINQIIINEIRDLRKVVETAMLCKCNKVNLSEKFDIKGQAKAAKELNISVSKLRYCIKEGNILKKNEHYRMSASGKYSFSKSALLSIKGLI